MTLETFLKNYINELLNDTSIPLEYAYSQIPVVPRLKQPVFLLLSMAQTPISFTLVSEDRAEIDDLRNRTKPMPLEYQKLLNLYKYYSTKDTRNAKLMQKLKQAVKLQMKQKNVSKHQLSAMIDTNHSMKHFSMTEYSRALILLKSKR